MNREDLSAPITQSAYSHRALVVVLLIIAAALRLYRLSGQSIWVDEMLTLSSSGITAPLHPIDIFDNLHGPLHSLILFLWTWVAGDSEFALRLPSVFFSVLSLIIIYRLLLRLSDSRTAIVALAILTFSPFHVWYGQEARNYSLLLFFSALSFDSFLSVLDRPGRADFGKYVLFTFLALLCNMSAAFLIIVQDIFFFFTPRRLSFRSLVIAHVLIALLLLPWLGGMLERVEFHRLVRTEPYTEVESLRGETTFSPFAIPYTFYVFSVGYSLGPGLRELHESTGVSAFSGHLSVIIPAAVCFSITFLLGIVSLRDRRRLLFLLLLWIIVPLVLVSLFAIKNFKPFNPRYVMVALPAYVLILAEGLKLRTGRHLSAVARVVLAVGILVLSVTSLWNHYHVARYQKDDFRAAANVLNTDFLPGDVVFAEGTYEPLIYYCEERIQLVPIFPGTIRDEQRLSSFILQESVGADRVWLVTSRLWNVDPEGKVRSQLNRFFGVNREFRFEGVDLTLFVNERQALSGRPRAGGASSRNRDCLRGPNIPRERPS